VLAAAAIVLLAPYAGCHILTSSPSDPADFGDDQLNYAGERTRSAGAAAGKLNDLDSFLKEK